jgi:AhpD family alkylhydroperoxidase
MIGRRMLSKVTARQVKYVQPVVYPPAGSLTAAVYGQVEREMTMVVPPVLMHSPAPDVAAAFWVLFRETLNATGVAHRRDKEVVAAAVSVANICPYCVDMHTTGMYDLAGEDDAEAVGGDRLSDLKDPAMRELALWARDAHIVAPATPGPPLFSDAYAAEVVGVVVAFHYLNRMVNVFLSDYLLPPRVRGTARRRLKRGVSMAMRPLLRRHAPPGEALPLLPEAPPAADAVWARGSTSIADAVARASAVFDAAGARALPDSVRSLIQARLVQWRGEEMGLSRAWCEDAIAELPAAERPAGRLALLTAFASYQVDGDVVEAFKQQQQGDDALVEATAWVSYTTARLIGARAGSRVGIPVSTEHSGRRR